MGNVTRILMRACCPQTESFTVIEAIKKNYIWNNIGNMLFPYSLFRLLYTPEVEITAYRDISDKDADYINKNYDCFVIPLANAFRTTFMPNLIVLTKLVKQLKIPCIVIGVGLQDKANPTLDTKYPFDDIVKEFCIEVLKHSKSIGVRGNITKQYIMNLGFNESNIDVIGCPSMYMNGREFKINKKACLDKNSIITMNGHAGIPEKIFDFFETIKEHFDNYYFIPQELHELKFLYAGVPFKAPAKYLSNPADEMYINDHCRMFVNVPSWLEFLRTADFSIGCRIHGNIAAILAGTPSFILAPDSRVQELAEFHGIPYMLAEDYSPNITIQELYDKSNFDRFNEINPKNFDNFIEFLEKNNLNHIYKYNGKSKFDDIIENIKFAAPVKPLFSIPVKDAAERLKLYNEWINEKFEKTNSNLRKKMANCEKELSEQKRVIKNQSKKLSYKSVKLGLSIHNTLVKIKKTTIRREK